METDGKGGYGRSIRKFIVPKAVHNQRFLLPNELTAMLVLKFTVSRYFTAPVTTDFNCADDARALGEQT